MPGIPPMSLDDDGVPHAAKKNMMKHSIHSMPSILIYVSAMCRKCNKYSKMATKFNATHARAHIVTACAGVDMKTKHLFSQGTQHSTCQACSILLCVGNGSISYCVQHALWCHSWQPSGISIQKVQGCCHGQHKTRRLVRHKLNWIFTAWLAPHWNKPTPTRSLQQRWKQSWLVVNLLSVFLTIMYTLQSIKDTLVLYHFYPTTTAQSTTNLWWRLIIIWLSWRSKASLLRNVLGWLLLSIAIDGSQVLHSNNVNILLIDTNGNLWVLTRSLLVGRKTEQMQWQ